MKDDNKIKRWACIAACLLVIAVLVVLITGQMSKPEQIKEEDVVSVGGEDAESAADDEAVEVTVPSISTESSESDVTVKSPNDSASTPSLEKDEGAAVNSGTEQTIQPDASRPESTADHSRPEESEPEQPAGRGEDTDSGGSTTGGGGNGGSGGPQHGDTRDGEIYVEGFGWIPNEGGGSNGTIVDGDGDINKQVGNM